MHSADAAGELPDQVMSDAYTFLQQQGCINMGVPAGGPDLPQQPEQEPEGPTEDDIIQGLYEILQDADLEV